MQERRRRSEWYHLLRGCHLLACAATPIQKDADQKVRTRVCPAALPQHPAGGVDSALTLAFALFLKLTLSICADLHPPLPSLVRTIAK